MKKPLFVSWIFVLTILAFTFSATGQTQPRASNASPQQINAYIANLSDSDLQTRLRAAEAIGELGPAGKPAVPALISLLDSENIPDKYAAMMALTRIGPEAKPAVPALKKLTAQDNPQLKRAAQTALDAIDPSLMLIIRRFVMRPYVLAGLIAFGVGAVALFAMLQRGGSAQQEVHTSKRPEADRHPTPKPQPPIQKPVQKPAATPASAGVAPTPAPAAPPASRVPAARARVSRSLPNLSNYMQETEGPESVKRDLVRSQEVLKQISDRQKDLANHLENEDLKRDPERLRQLKKDVDEYALEHYKAEVRVKALEVKMLEVLLGDGKSTDAELRARTEATIRQKLQDLRTMCETPAKITFRSDDWVSVAAGATHPIADLRAHLHELGIDMIEHSLVDEPPGPKTPTTPQTPVEPIVEPTEATAEPATEPEAEVAAESAAEAESAPETAAEPADEPAGETAETKKPETEPPGESTPA